MTLNRDTSRSKHWAKTKVEWQPENKHPDISAPQGMQHSRLPSLKRYYNGVIQEDIRWLPSAWQPDSGGFVTTLSLGT